MRYLASWRHLFTKRELDDQEWDWPATKRDIANVSDQTLRRVLVLFGLLLLVSGGLYIDQGRRQHANDAELAKTQLLNAQLQRRSSISGCKRQNQLRSVNRDNLKAEHTADRANRKLFRPEQFGLTQRQFNTLVKQSDRRFRQALHRLQPARCAEKYPPPHSAQIIGGD